ncbi:MAG: hypothetical protein Q9M19_00425 [Mariprofundaceae bacterium]|nr:hypothetical protein [Mariprofundaceae bacterium]
MIGLIELLLFILIAAVVLWVFFKPYPHHNAKNCPQNIQKKQSNPKNNAKDTPPS